MLDWMRKNAGNWLVKFVLGAIVVVFVFWGIGSWRAEKASQVAQVNDRVVTVEQYRRAYDLLVEQMRQTLGNQLDEKMLEALNLKGQALNQLVDRTLLLGEADRLGLRVDDQELAQAIANVPAFQNNGRFDRRRYDRLLQMNRLSPEQFEVSQREAMLLDKLRLVVTAAVQVSDEETRAFYDWTNARVRVDYVIFEPSLFPAPTVTDEAVQAHYEASKQRYKTEETIKARYLRFAPADFASRVTLEEADLRSYYEEHPEEFRTEKTVEARHILIRVDEKAPAEQVAAARDKIVGILETIRNGTDFAEAARQHSEDPTRENGGYLGTFGRRALVQPFAEQAFALQPGQVSEPVRTAFGWHLIKVEKINPETVQSFEQASGAIRDKLVAARSKTLAFDEAEKAYELLETAPDMEKAAAAVGLKVLETGFFAGQGDPTIGVGDPQGFAGAAYALEAKRISDITDLADGYYLIQVVERKAGVIPELAGVKDKVRAELVANGQDEQARAAAKELIQKVKDGMALSDVAGQMGRKVATTGFFKRNEPIAELGPESAVTTAAFALTTAKPLSDSPVKGAKGYHVLRLVQRQLPEAEAYEKEKESVVAKLSQQKKTKAFEALLEDIRKRSTIHIAEAYRS